MFNRFPLLAFLLGAACAVSDAFTLDFVGYEGGALPPVPAAMTVPGYGEVLLHAMDDTGLVVCSAWSNDPFSDRKIITFQEKDAVQVKLKENGRDAGKSAEEEPKSVPEPAAMFLGLIGGILLLICRRR
jgi:hypothetical protein